jgi:hypothetical protein
VDGRVHPDGIAALARIAAEVNRAWRTSARAAFTP